MRKKLFSISAACLSGLLLGVLASCGPNSGLTESHDSTGGNEGFDISFDANSHVYAKLESKTNGKNKPIISGSGKIKDFANATDRPHAKNNTQAGNIGSLSAVHHTSIGEVFGQSSRYFTTLSDKVMAEAFHSFIISDAGKAIYHPAA